MPRPPHETKFLYVVLSEKKILYQVNIKFHHVAYLLTYLLWKEIKFYVLGLVVFSNTPSSWILLFWEFLMQTISIILWYKWNMIRGHWWNVCLKGFTLFLMVLAFSKGYNMKENRQLLLSLPIFNLHHHNRMKWLNYPICFSLTCTHHCYHYHFTAPSVWQKKKKKKKKRGKRWKTKKSRFGKLFLFMFQKPLSKIHFVGSEHIFEKYILRYYIRKFLLKFLF